MDQRAILKRLTVAVSQEKPLEAAMKTLPAAILHQGGFCVPAGEIVFDDKKVEWVGFDKMRNKYVKARMLGVFGHPDRYLKQIVENTNQNLNWTVIPLLWLEGDYKTIHVEEDVWSVSLQEDSLTVPTDVDAVNRAVKTVNDSLTGKQGLWSVFGQFPLGAQIPVQVDYSQDYAAREENARGGDVLGAYDPVGGGITLYGKAILEYAREKGLELTNVYAMVLAHELFHAWQDYFADISGRTDSEGETVRHEKLETYAEYFSLRYAKCGLGDAALFAKMCAVRGAESANDYSAALTEFGSVADDASEQEFLERLQKWVEQEKESLKFRVY